MSIKTLLFAGAATFGLCAGAQAQTQTAVNGVGAQTAIQVLTQRNTQTITQGRALANTAVQVQIPVNTAINTNVALQNNTNVAIPIRVLSPGSN
jgi:hypothetical protein